MGDSIAVVLSDYGEVNLEWARAANELELRELSDVPLVTMRTEPGWRSNCNEGPARDLRLLLLLQRHSSL